MYDGAAGSAAAALLAGDRRWGPAGQGLQLRDGAAGGSGPAGTVTPVSSGVQHSAPVRLHGWLDRPGERVTVSLQCGAGELETVVAEHRCALHCSVFFGLLLCHHLLMILCG